MNEHVRSWTRRIHPLVWAAGVALVGLAAIVGAAELLASTIHDHDTKIVISLLIGLVGGIPVGQGALVAYWWARDRV